MSQECHKMELRKELLYKEEIIKNVKGTNGGIYITTESVAAELGSSDIFPKDGKRQVYLSDDRFKEYKETNNKDVFYDW